MHSVHLFFILKQFNDIFVFIKQRYVDNSNFMLCFRFCYLLREWLITDIFIKSTSSVILCSIISAVYNGTYQVYLVINVLNDCDLFKGRLILADLDGTDYLLHTSVSLLAPSACPSNAKLTNNGISVLQLRLIWSEVVSKSGVDLYANWIIRGNIRYVIQ